MACRKLFVTALALVSFYAPKALLAQATDAAAKPAASAPQGVDPKLRSFAKVQFTLNLARDEYNAALSKAHEPGAKDEAMDAFAKKKGEIFANNGTTELAYYQELFIVCSDLAQRDVFDRVMKELAAQ